MRTGVSGTLYVDETEVASGQASGSSKVVNGLQELFLGGVPEGFDSKRIPVSGVFYFIFLIYFLSNLLIYICNAHLKTYVEFARYKCILLLLLL